MQWDKWSILNHSCLVSPVYSPHYMPVLKKVGDHLFATEQSCTPVLTMLWKSGSSEEENSTFYMQLWFSWIMAGHTCHLCLIFSCSNKLCLQKNGFSDPYSANYFLILVFKDLYSDFLGRCRVWPVYIPWSTCALSQPGIFRATNFTSGKSSFHHGRLNHFRCFSVNKYIQYHCFIDSKALFLANKQPLGTQRPWPVIVHAHFFFLPCFRCTF